MHVNTYGEKGNNSKHTIKGQHVIHVHITVNFITSNYVTL